MRSVNEQLLQMELPEISMGIGINTGEVVAGNIGSQSRAKYGVVGNHVNLTARIESYTVGGQILISENTYNEVQEIVKTNGSMQVEPKGVSQPIFIYDICGIEGTYNLELPSVSDSLRVLSMPIPITYRILEEKHLGAEIFEGELRRLSPYGAEIFSEQEVPVLANLKLYLKVYDQNQQLEIEDEIYAKVLKRQQPHQAMLLDQVMSENLILENRLTIAAIPKQRSRHIKQTYVHFTTVPSDLKVWIKSATL